MSNKNNPVCVICERQRDDVRYRADAQLHVCDECEARCIEIAKTLKPAK